MRYLIGENINVKIGLEIHFQLNGIKLFCSCPTEGNTESRGTFMRKLKASYGEEFKKDIAASLESLKDREFFYSITDNSCLVEFDEEPPHLPSWDNIEAALKASLLLNCKLVDGITFMRKIVIDGSNTSGFQRTAIIGIEGNYVYRNKKIGISTVSLEEEACRKIDEKNDTVYYSLDRLGIPLIEVSTKPDINSPSEAREVAKGIGLLIRRIGKVQRDVDSIRQDLNISIEGGNRVEIKGVQSLSMIETVLKNEIMRQKSLLEISEILNERSFKQEFKSLEFEDITENAKYWSSTVIKKGINEDKKVFAFLLPKLKGLLKNGNFRLGKELAERLKVLGIGGLIHSDELPNYGISDENVRWVYNRLGSGPLDAFGILVISDEQVDISRAILQARLLEAIHGVPAETRGVIGTETRFLRPLPGSARMYPETDIPFIEISEKVIESVMKNLPKGIDERIEELTKKGVPRQEAIVSLDLGTDEIIEKLIDEYGNPSLIASAVNKFKPKNSEIKKLEKIFKLLNEKRISKEAIEELYNNPEKIDTATNVKEPNDVIIKRIYDIIHKNKDIIRVKREASFSVLMGEVMKEVRGKLDGKLISKIVKDEIDKIIHND